MKLNCLESQIRRGTKKKENMRERERERERGLYDSVYWSMSIGEITYFSCIPSMIELVPNLD